MRSLSEVKQGPLISVITPVKNGEARLQRAIDSAAAQVWPYEHIIVDGMSTDGTAAIIEKNQHRITKTIRAPDNSATEALRRGVCESSGDIICMLMSDDWIAENALTAVGTAFRTDQRLEIVVGAVKIVDEITSPKQDDTLFTAPQPPLDINRFLGQPYAAAYFFRRSLWEKLNGFRLDYRYGADRDFMMRCHLCNAAALSIPDIVYVYSINVNSDTLVEKQSVVEAFLEDHLLMAKDWLSNSNMSNSKKKTIKQWRRTQVNELTARKIKAGRPLHGMQLFASAALRDPAQIPSALQWLERMYSAKKDK